jgi:hypothetical protein
LQTGLDVVATMVWWDWQTPEMLEAQDQDANSQTGDSSTLSLSTFLIPLFWLTLLPVVFLLAKSSKDSKVLEDIHLKKD